MTDRSVPSPAGRAGFYVAVAAIAVNAPRLVLAFLEVDGLAVAPAWRMALLGLTGVATGVVLTGGGAYLAHALSISRGSGRYSRLLAATWLLVLTCSTALVAPVLVAGLGRESLPRVLPSAGLRWSWSAVAVLAVELVAAGSMVAQGAGNEEKLRSHEAELELLEVARERNELRARVVELSRRGAPAAREGRAPEAPAAREQQAPPAARGGAATVRSAQQQAPPARARKVGEVSRKPELPEGPVPCRNGCGWVGSSRRAECGHQKGCPARRREKPSRTATVGT